MRILLSIKCSSGENDENFIDCLWDKDPLYFTDREAYLFDYRLQDDSPAFGAGNPSLTLPATASDAFGTPRDLTAPALGAYERQPE